MFTGFTKETGDFLWELSFNNERPWFLQHKEQYERCLLRPMKALAADTAALMAEKFPGEDWQMHISRIYRDARRLFGRGPYKDHMWLSFKAGEIEGEGPMLWFEIGASCYSYGMGFYEASPSQMAAFRRTVDANPSRFARLASGIEASGRYAVTGEEYKRPKGDRGELINRWYNRRHIGLSHQEDFGGALLTPELPSLLTESYRELMPMYQFFMEFYRLAGEEG